MTCILIVKSDTTLVDKKNLSISILTNILVKQREHLWLKMQKEVKKNTNFRLANYECENYEDAEKAINSKI